MKQLAFLIVLVIAASILLSIVGGSAQTSISSWPFFVEVTTSAGVPGIYDLMVPLHVMDKSREDLADLRLYDARGREIPYALRIRKEIDEKREIGGHVFNQATVGRASEVSVDLGESPGEHNEVEIETAGNNFRRRVDLEGGDSGKEWHTLRTSEVIFSFESQNKLVESNRVSYPASRYRYLRARVFADELTDEQAPEVTGLKAVMAVHQRGELTTWSVSIPQFELNRRQGAPASSWTLDLSARVPCDRIALEVADESFSRPFQLEAIDDLQNIRLIASGDLTRRIGEARRPLVITFDEEQYARKLRLSIIDYSNQLLTISSITASAPARQLVFELKEAPVQPLHLLFGNTKATVPHYDFEQDLRARLGTKPTRTQVGAISNNPEFKPEPLPLTERIPWLIYVVLAASSLALALILISLARTTLQSEPQPEGSQTPGKTG